LLYHVEVTFFAETRDGIVRIGKYDFWLFHIIVYIPVLDREKSHNDDPDLPSKQAAEMTHY
jgi:hypothetical protein